MSGELFEDVKAMDQVSRSLALADPQTIGEVAAMERGRREHPDGVVEEYQRLEFRPKG